MTTNACPHHDLPPKVERAQESLKNPKKSVSFRASQNTDTEAADAEARLSSSSTQARACCECMGVDVGVNSLPCSYNSFDNILFEPLYMPRRILVSCTNNITGKSPGQGTEELEERPKLPGSEEWFSAKGGLGGEDTRGCDTSTESTRTESTSSVSSENSSESKGKRRSLMSSLFGGSSTKSVRGQSSKPQHPQNGSKRNNRRQLDHRLRSSISRQAGLGILDKLKGHLRMNTNATIWELWKNSRTDACLHACVHITES